MFGGLWDSFIRFKAAQVVSERTLSDYEVRVKKLFLSRFPTGDAQELRDSVLLFLSEPAAPATFNLKVAYLKVFFAWARDSGVDVGDPQRIMGYSTMDMTKTYLAFTPEDLHREHEKASPLESLTESAPRRRCRAR